VGDSPTAIRRIVDLAEFLWQVAQTVLAAQALYRWWKPRQSREESLTGRLFAKLDGFSGRLDRLGVSFRETSHDVYRLAEEYLVLARDIDCLGRGQREAAEKIRSLSEDHSYFVAVLERLEGIEEGLVALTAKVDGLTQIEDVKGCVESATSDLAQDAPTVDRFESTEVSSEAPEATPPAEEPTQTESHSELSNETVSEVGMPMPVLAVEEGDNGGSPEPAVTQDPAPANDSSPAPVLADEEETLDSAPEQSVLAEEQNASSTEQADAHDSAPTLEGQSEEASTSLSESAAIPAGSTDEVSCSMSFSLRLLTSHRSRPMGQSWVGKTLVRTHPSGLSPRCLNSATFRS
jgi:hypothetical protein